MQNSKLSDSKRQSTITTEDETQRKSSIIK